MFKSIIVTISLAFGSSVHAFEHISVGSEAFASTKCDMKAAFEAAIRENLNSSVAFDEILEIKKQDDGSYFVEFAYVGDDFRDSGYFVFEFDKKACKASRK